MFIDDLKKSILQKAIQWKLVNQNQNDEPASELLKRIKEEKEKLIKDGKIKKEKALIPITDEEKPFEIPSNWSWVRLWEIEEINLWFTYKPEYTEWGVHFLSVKDISGGKIDFSNTQFVSQETYDNAPYWSKPKKWDILFWRVWTMGKPQILDVDEKFCIFVSLGFLRDHSWILNKKYICYWMNSFLFRNQVNYWVKWAAVKNLNTTRLAKFLVPIPPLEEQKRIVAKLDELLPLLEDARPLEEEIMNLEKQFPNKLRQAILQYAIQWKLVEQDSKEEPASVLLKKIKEEKERLVKEWKIKKEKPLAPITNEEKPFEIPSNWEWVRLGNISKPLNDWVHYAPEYVEDWIPCFSAKDIYNNCINLEKCNYITEEEYNSMKDKISIERNSLLVTKSWSIWRSAIVDNYFIFWLVESIWVINLIEVVPQYIKSILDYGFVYSNMFFDRYTNWIWVKHLTLTSLTKILIPLPPLEEQKRIVAKLDELLKLCDDLEGSVK